MNKVKVGGKYKHYRGYVYEVMYVGRDSSSLEEVCRDSNRLEKVVIYRGLYVSKQFGKNPIWVRPLKEFLGEVEVNGKKIKRFVFVE